MMDLDKLKALADAATPGPWRECGAHRGGCTCGLVWSVPLDALVAHAHELVDSTMRADAAFIAAAREAVPQLVAEVERLQGLLRDAQTRVEVERHRAEQAEGWYDGQRAGNEVMGRERDAALAEVERLRARVQDGRDLDAEVVAGVQAQRDDLRGLAGEGEA